MVDGSITIRTRIDQSGFVSGSKQLKSGLTGLTKSLKSFAVAAGLAFSTAAVINFGKASLTAAGKLKSAFTGLTSIVTGQNKSFKEANKFIQEYISDGLIPATDAITAYKNLLMRGYSTKQVEQVLTALKNSAAYGRQASLTMGEAVSSASEGLKNENSILVDNAGVTKNVSMMWKDYADSIGVGVNSLTKQQKIQAEVNGIMQETRFQMGDAAKLASDYSGQVVQLSFNFNNLKIAIGNMIMPIAQSILPAVNSLIIGLTKVANLMAQITTALFGQAHSQQNVAGEISDAVAQQEALTEATKETEKAAKKALAPWDELHVLSSDKGGSAAAEVSPGKAGGSSGEIGGNIEVSPNIQRIADKIKSIFAPLTTISLDNLSDSFGRLKKSMGPITKTLFSGLEWGYINIFIPLSKFVIEDYLPRFLDALASSTKFAGKIIAEYFKFYQQFFDKFLKPIAKFSAEKTLRFMESLNDRIKEFSKRVNESEAFNELRGILDKIYPILVSVVKRLINIQSFFSNFSIGSVFNILEKNFADLEDRIGLIADLLNGDFSGAWEHLKDLLIDNKIEFVKKQFNNLKDSLIEFSGMAEDSVKSVDVFGEGISTATKTKLQPFLSKIRELDDMVVSIDYTGAVVDQKTVNAIKKQVGSIADTIIKELSVDKNQALANLKPLEKIMGTEAYNALLDKNNDYYSSITTKVQKGEKRINSIVSKAAAEKRTLTESEKKEILRIRDEMNSAGVRQMSESELEYRTIMNRLKDNSTRISLEQSGEIIKNAQKTRDASIEAARKQYESVVFEAERMRDAGIISDEEYNKIIEAAKKAKDETIKSADEQYSSIVNTTKSKLGENAKYLDENTGKIKSKWDVFTSDLKTAWGDAWKGISKGWESFKDNFKTGWDKFWKGVGNFFIDTWNNILGGIEKAINAIVQAVNNKFSFTTPDWLPDGMGGKKVGFNLDLISIKRVPRLATGAVIPPRAEFLAVLGDQKSGRNLEAPENLIRQIVREESGRGTERIDINMPVHIQDGPLIGYIVQTLVREGRYGRFVPKEV